MWKKKPLNIHQMVKMSTSFASSGAKYSSYDARKYTLPQSFQGRRWAERTLHYLLAKWWVRSCLDASISTQMHNSYPKDTLTLILTCFPHCYCTVHPLWPRNVLHMLADKWMRHCTEKDSQQPLNNLAGIGYFVTVWIVPWLVREQTWHLIS